MKLFNVYTILFMLNTLFELACHCVRIKSLKTIIMETRNKSCNISQSKYFMKNGTQKRKPIAIKYEEPKSEITTDEIENSKTKRNLKKKQLTTEKKNEVNTTTANKETVLKKSCTGKEIGEHTNLEFDNGKKSKWEPPHWREVLENIREMRKKGDAPVDTMGCDQSSDIALAPEVRRYHVLISLMLSSQTKDEVNHAAMCRLKQHGLTVENICNTPEDILGQLIIPVGFWKTKAKHIKMASEILRKEYKGDIPNSIPLLCKLPGVGPKMAHLCMNHAWGIVTGIGVDIHVHRISHRLGWTKVFKTPEDTRKQLESWLPESLWSDVNHLLVGFGQQICKSLRPSCETCLNRDLCPQGKKELAERAKKATKKTNS